MISQELLDILEDKFKGILGDEINESQILYKVIRIFMQPLGFICNRRDFNEINWIVMESQRLYGITLVLMESIIW